MPEELFASEKTFTIPQDFADGDVLAVEVIPKSSDGRIGASAFTYAAQPDIDVNFVTTVKYGEDFSENQPNGWYHSDSSNGSVHSLTTAGGVLKLTTFGTWYENAYAGKLFDDLDLGTKQYIGFDVMFLDSDNYDPTETKYYVSLIDSQERRLGIMYLSKYTIDSLAYNGSTCGRYNIASGMDSIYNNWYKIKIYFDTESNKYAVSVNGEFLENDSFGIFFTPTDSREFGSGNAVTAGGIRGIELASERFSVNTGICLDNLEVGTYDVSDELPWSAEEVGFADGSVDFRIRENYAAHGGGIYIASYEDDELYSVKIIDNVIFENGVYEDNVDIDIPESNGRVRIFMWNDAMKPIGEPIEQLISY